MPAKLEVITGPMFSGKSAELIRLLNRATYARKKILVIKPSIDHRSGENRIAERAIKNGKSAVVEDFPAFSIGTLEEFWNVVNKNDFDVLAIDEAQFFTQPWFVSVDFIAAVQELLDKHSQEDFRIIIAGLDMTAQMEPFGPMPQLLAMADEVTKLTAVCFNCGATARYTQILGGTGEEIQVGDLDLYEARCRKCHVKNKT